MPLVEGENLRRRLDRDGQLAVEEAVRIASRVADALDRAHRHGVIHRDLKAANILFQDGEPVVADFGIAIAVSAAGEDRLQTANGVLKSDQRVEECDFDECRPLSLRIEPSDDEDGHGLLHKTGIAPFHEPRKCLGQVFTASQRGSRQGG